MNPVLIVWLSLMCQHCTADLYEPPRAEKACFHNGRGTPRWCQPPKHELPVYIPGGPIKPWRRGT